MRKYAIKRIGVIVPKFVTGEDESVWNVSPNLDEARLFNGLSAVVEAVVTRAVAMGPLSYAYTIVGVDVVDQPTYVEVAL